jgi:hypothetical protein
MRLPALVAHADWSVDARKRWLARATLLPNGRYRAAAPHPVGPLGSLLKRLEAEAGDGPILLGFNFPIGLPRAYAKQEGIEHFVAALTSFEDGFYDVATQKGEISLKRPFYPYSPGGRSQQDLVKGLNLTWRELLRRCDRASGARPEACTLFWTHGPKQVGKAAITGWRDLLTPALRDGLDLGLWPFDGRLDKLLARHRFVVAETYPAEFYRHLKLKMAGGKGKQEVRQANAGRLLEWATKAGVDLEGCLIDQIRDGFGAAARGDDRFDAVVGLFGMLNVVLGNRKSGEPDDDDSVRRVEGWILGQDAS